MLPDLNSIRYVEPCPECNEPRSGLGVGRDYHRKAGGFYVACLECGFDGPKRGSLQLAVDGWNHYPAECGGPKRLGSLLETVLDNILDGSLLDGVSEPPPEQPVDLTDFQQVSINQPQPAKVS